MCYRRHTGTLEIGGGGGGGGGGASNCLEFYNEINATCQQCYVANIAQFNLPE